MSGRLHFQPEIETMPPERLRELQLERFRHAVARVMSHSPFYRDLYASSGVDPEDIQSFEDIGEIPLLDRRQIESFFPFAGLCSDPMRIREIHSTAGSRSQRPFLVAATQHDIDYWADLNARALWMAGLRPGDVLLNAFPTGITTWGFGLHYGALKLGMASVPAGNLPPEQLLELMVDAEATALSATPSKALNLARVVERKKLDLRERARCRVAILGAEPWSRAIRERIETGLGVRAFDLYGMSELLGPAMGCECELRDRKFGMHIWADAFLCECIDPRTGARVGEGEEGELVWTSLVWEGTPLIRYRSGDLSSITWASCDCGRTHPRMSAIKGRAEDAVSLEGIIVYPSQVEETLLAFEEAGSQTRIVVDRDKRGVDFLSVRVELKDKSLIQDQALCQALARRMKEAVRQATGILPREVELLPPGGLRKATGSEERTPVVRLEDRRSK